MQGRLKLIIWFQVALLLGFIYLAEARLMWNAKRTNHFL